MPEVLTHVHDIVSKRQRETKALNEVNSSDKTCPPAVQAPFLISPFLESIFNYDI